jgi:hypothetical protein
MEHREITPALVMEADRLLSQGLDCPTVAARLGITTYLVEVIAGDEIGRGLRPPPGRANSRIMNRSPGIDAVTLRRIQRMLAGGWLRHLQIAREAGVSGNTVSEVAQGRRPISTMRYMELGEGEVFLPEALRWLSVAAEKGATFAARGGQFSGCAVERELQLD